MQGSDFAINAHSPFLFIFSCHRLAQWLILLYNFNQAMVGSGVLDFSN